MNNYIYVLRRKYAYSDVVKIGSTQNIKKRMSIYKTNEPKFNNDTFDLWTFEILNDDITCGELENFIYKLSKEISKPYEKYSGDGGKEFYIFTRIKELEIFFDKLKIKYIMVKQNLNEIKTTNNIINDDIVDKKVIISEDKFEKYWKIYNKNDTKNTNEKDARDYQINAISSAINYFNTNKIGKIIMPCGSGKSYVMFSIIRELKYNKYLVLVPSLYLISQIGEMFDELFTKFNYKTNMCFICSNYSAKLNKYKRFNSLDDDTINLYTKKNNKFIIISTYQSCLSMSKINFDIIMFDEAHKTTTCPKKEEDATGFNYFLLNYNKSKKLFFTATEKHFKFECNNTIINNKIIQISMNNENLYGKTIFYMSLIDGIKKNALCDYKIIVSVFNVNDASLQKDIKKINNNDFDDMNKYYVKAKALIKFINKYNVTHIITKHNKVENCNYFENILKKLCDKKYYIDTIDGTMNMTTRNNKINNFIKSKIGILCSARCLSEGVNIPIIDCVVPIDNMESSIDIIQFVGRALRLYPKKDISYVFIPMIVYDDDLINIKNDYNNLRILLRTISYHDYRIHHWISKNTLLDKEYEKSNNDDLIYFDNILEEKILDKLKNNIKINLIDDFNKFSPECFEKSREIIRNKNFINKEEYYEWCNERIDNFNIPKNPDKVYKTLGWKSWDDYLGFSWNIVHDFCIKYINLKESVIFCNKIIIYLVDKRNFYIGFTNDLEKQSSEHILTNKMNVMYVLFKNLKKKDCINIIDNIKYINNHTCLNKSNNFNRIINDNDDNYCLYVLLYYRRLRYENKYLIKYKF